MSKSIILILIALIIVLIAGAGFLIFQNQKLISKLSKQVQEPTPVLSPFAQTSPEPSISPSPSPKLSLAALYENIEAAINSKNLAALATYMTNPISVILQASECCGPQTPDEAVTQMAYIDPGTPFDFNQNTDLVKNLKAKNSELAGKFIGISKNGEQFIALGLNSQNRIADIRMSVSYKLFSY